MSSTRTRFVLIGGNPFTSYTGTGTFTRLAVVGTADTEEEIKAVTDREYDSCGGLLLWVDTVTGLSGEGDFGAPKENP